MTKGKIHSIETFGSVDGPGVRFLVFMQGCPMRCAYCHNPDTWSFDGGEAVTAPEILKKALRYKSYWGDKGGITVSGGEPLAQLDFLIELFELCKEEGINTCVDTSGQPFTRSEPFFGKFKRLTELCDLFLVDIKHINSEEHRKLTKHPNENILDMLSYLSEIGKPVWIRQVLVPEITDNDVYLNRTREFINTLSNVEKVEVLPYHTLGEYKWRELGLGYPLEGVEPPSPERIKNAEKILL